MSRGGSYGGGQSSLGYLFQVDEHPSAPPVTQTIQPPYGIDTISTEKPPDAHQHPKGTEKRATNSRTETQKYATNNYHRAQGQNSRNFIIDRPSTKVRFVSGGDSSMGYLFGDK